MRSLPNWMQHKLLLQSVQYLLFSALMLFLLSYSWVGDDAFITFSVIDNFVNGYGLRYNIDERVQVYTHPLWMILEIPTYMLGGRNIYVSSFFTSAITGILALWLLMYNPRASLIQKILLCLLPLAVSKLVRDHISCGLETPLQWLLTVAFLYMYIYKPHRLYIIFTLAALCMLTRLDMVIILAPAALHTLLRNIKTPHLIRRVVMASLPLVAWLGFSLIYYGFIFPNTRYAKLNTGIPLAVYMKQGAYYFGDLVKYDKAAMFTILSYLAVAIASMRNRDYGRVYQNPYVMMAAGILIHFAYVLCIGGDFMSGRFFAVPFIMSVFGLYHILSAQKLSRSVVWAAVLMMCVALQNTPQSVFNEVDTEESHHGIIEERLFYYYCSNVFVDGIHFRDRSECADAYNAYERFNYFEAHPDEKKFVYYSAVGMMGYYTTPDTIVIDWLAIAEPMLARLPYNMDGGWRPGHYVRSWLNPDMYIQARVFRNLKPMPRTLRTYYRKLWSIIHDPVWDEKRLKTLWKMQMGDYDGLLKRFLDKHYYKKPE